MTDQTDKSGFAAILAAGTVIILLLGSIGFVLLQLRVPADRFSACREVQVAGGQKLGGAFEHTDQFGNRITDVELFEKPALVYFGYTFCPDVCPLDVVRNVEAVDVLEANGHDVTPVFITVDPDRDTVEALNDYAYAMHPKMVALTGDSAKLKRTLTMFGGSASKQDDDPEYYLMSHTTLTYLMIPGEGAVALFTRRLAPDDLAKRTQCYLDIAAG